jgi:hypothetical protein
VSKELEPVIDVVVNRGWRVHHRGVVYESGELATLPVLLGCEWSGWGSVTAVHGTYRVVEAA